LGTDRPDEPEMPPDGHPDRGDDQGGDRGRPPRSGGLPPEDRDREEYYVSLRRTVSTEQAITARHAAAEEQAVYEKWEKESEEFRWIWAEYQRRLPPSERPRPDRPQDEPGSWRGEGDSYLSPADNERVEAACDQIASRERDQITPAMREIESQDPDRHLAGLEHARKGRDRIKEKVHRGINNYGRSPEQAVSNVPDTIRFTFQYPEARYTQGVWADIGRLEQQGFEQRIRKNSWSGDQYKGINSQWIDPESGQRFEVQFHTRISFEAKQLTHESYERLRAKQPDVFEQMVLEAFQKKVTAEVPVPPGAIEIPDYPKRDRNGR
jgi:hypothetical protein